MTAMDGKAWLGSTIPYLMIAVREMEHVRSTFHQAITTFLRRTSTP